MQVSLAVVESDLGAGDYAPKSFKLRELVARVNAALRRGPLVGTRYFMARQQAVFQAIRTFEVPAAKHDD